MNPVYKYTFNFALVLLLSACASDSSNKSKQQSPVSTMAKQPVAQPVAPARRSPQAYQYTPPVNPYSASALTGVYANSPAVQRFIRHMVQEHGFSESYLNSLFSQATLLDSVIRLETAQAPTATTPPRPGSWSRYREKFLTDAHINNGVAFWSSNADSIRKASAAYGVDPEYIVAIIGVETYFGRNIGKTRIFDALSTLAFATERRSRFFTSELESFLLMTREEGFEPFQPVGSWAGAMGLGQFMPSSFRSLAVDFNNDGSRNLWDPQDAIGSVAHYFSRNGWQPRQPVARPADTRAAASTIALNTYSGDEFWQVFPNFKVIKRYNNSDKYAMAVHQLAQAIKQRYQG